MAEKTKKKDITFGKNTILKSEKYRNREDLLNVLLQDGNRYTFEEVDKLITSFMKGGK